MVFSFTMIWRKSPIRKINRITGFMQLLIVTVVLFYLYLHQAIADKNMLFFRYYIPVDYLFCLLLGPAHHFQLLLVLNHTWPNPFRKLWKHTLPFFLVLLYILYYISLPLQVRTEIFFDTNGSFNWKMNIPNLMFYVQLVVYLLLSMKYIRKEMAISKTIIHNGVQVNLVWYRNMLHVWSLLLVVVAALSFFIPYYLVNSFAGAFMLCIYFIIKTIWVSPTFRILPMHFSGKKNRLPVREEKKADLEVRLPEYIQSSKIYLNHGCTIKEVAHELLVQPYQLSNYMNDNLNTTFPVFINQYRIAEAKKMLLEKNGISLTIEAVGQACGFASKSSFNKAFKDITGQTPSEYRQLFFRDE
jgi:AraC-like DNA-binding protein